MKAYLIRIDARDGAGAPLTMRFASHDDAGLCHYGGDTWWPAIAKLPSLSFDFFDGGFRGNINDPAGSFLLSINGLPSMVSAIWSDAAISIYRMDFNQSVVENLSTLFTGRVRSQPRFDAGLAEIDFESDSRWLDEPLLDTYAGSGGVEGPDELQGEVKPFLIGAPRFVPGVLIDAVDNIYQVSAYGAIQGVEAVYDRLSSLGASSGNYASLAALLTASVANGSWATCNALGLVRLGAPPDGQVCFHVSGDNVGGWHQLPGSIVTRMAFIAGGVISLGSIAAINGARPYNLSVAVIDQITPRELIQSIAASIKAVAGVDWSGNLFIAPLGIGSAVATLNSDGSSLPAIADVKQLPVDPPFWRLATESEKTWVIHGDADIAYQFNLRGAYSVDRVYRLDDVVTTGDGSSWRFLGATPLAGSTPFDGNPNWERRSAATVTDFADVTGSTKPDNNADVTATKNAAGVVGAGPALFAPDLAGFDAPASAKLTGIAAGATVGADWASNLASRPVWAVDGRSGEGLDALGFVNLLVPQGKAGHIISSGVTGAGPALFADANQVMNNRLENSVVKIPNPGGAQGYNGSSGAVGGLKVRLPKGIYTGGSPMISFEVPVYNFNNELVTYYLSGYIINGTSWYSARATAVGRSASVRSVRFGHDGTYWCVWIGETSTVWGYPRLSVRNFECSFQDLTTAFWESGWAIQIETSFLVVDQYVQHPVAGDAIFGSNTLQSLGGALATNSLYRTPDGNSGGVNGAGPWLFEGGYTPTIANGKTQNLGTNGRVTDGRAFNSNTNFGKRYLPVGVAITDTPAGGTVTINIAASVYNSDWGGAIAFPAATMPGYAYGTKYHVWRTQPDPTTAGVAYGIATNELEALGTDKAYLGYFTTRADAGAPPPPPPPAPPPSGYPDP